MTESLKKSEEIGRVSSNYNSAKKEVSYQTVKLEEDYTSICDERNWGCREKKVNIKGI